MLNQRHIYFTASEVGHRRHHHILRQTNKRKQGSNQACCAQGAVSDPLAHHIIAAMKSLYRDCLIPQTLHACLTCFRRNERKIQKPERILGT